MLDKYIYTFLHFIMKHAGQLNSWAWRKHVKILEKKRIFRLQSKNGVKHDHVNKDHANEKDKK